FCRCRPRATATTALLACHRRITDQPGHAVAEPVVRPHQPGDRQNQIDEQAPGTEHRVQVPIETASLLRPVHGQPYAPVKGLAWPSQVQTGQAEEHQNQRARRRDLLAVLASRKEAMKIQDETEKVLTDRIFRELAGVGIEVVHFATALAGNRGSELARRGGYIRWISSGRASAFASKLTPTGTDTPPPRGQGEFCRSDRFAFRSKVEAGAHQRRTASSHVGVVGGEHLVVITFVGQVLHVQLQVNVFGQRVRSHCVVAPVGRHFHRVGFITETRVHKRRATTNGQLGHQFVGRPEIEAVTWRARHVVALVRLAGGFDDLALHVGIAAVDLPFAGDVAAVGQLQTVDALLAIQHLERRVV
nr:hypothetical protein [Tanacetum cinerariifolium]